MDWLEDTERFEEAHELLDQVGTFVRRAIPEACAVLFEGGTYYNVCPIALGHIRIGMSPGYVVHKAECSICHKNPWDCEHITGRDYDGEPCYRIITEAEFFEISFVDRPSQPDARIQKMSVDTADIREMLGDRFEVGMEVVCDDASRRAAGSRIGVETRSAQRSYLVPVRPVRRS